MGKQSTSKCLSLLLIAFSFTFIITGRGAGGSVAQEAVRRRQRGSESGEEAPAQLEGRRAARRVERRRQRSSEGAGRLGERSGGDSAARRAPGGSESGEEATAQLGGCQAARRAERRRLRGYEGRRGGSAVTQFLKRCELLLRSGCPYFKYSACRARITSS